MGEHSDFHVGDQWHTLARGQKISAVVLLICGTVVLGLSVQRIHAGVNGPFTVTKEKVAEATRKVSEIDVDGRKLEESKRRDTDGDGLSDYDEENILGTSPYLADTDGDGLTDNVELALGENPNCARGTQCRGTVVNTAALENAPDPFQSVANEDVSGNDLFAEFQRGMNNQRDIIREQTGSTSTRLEPALVRDPVDIRAALRDSGEIDVDLLDQLTDDDLLRLYDEALALTAKDGAEALTGSPGQ